MSYRSRPRGKAPRPVKEGPRDPSLTFAFSSQAHYLEWMDHQTTSRAARMILGIVDHADEAKVQAFEAAVGLADTQVAVKNAILAFFDIPPIPAPSAEKQEPDDAPE